MGNSCFKVEDVTLEEHSMEAEDLNTSSSSFVKIQSGDSDTQVNAMLRNCSDQGDDNSMTATNSGPTLGSTNSMTLQDLADAEGKGSDGDGGMAARKEAYMARKKEKAQKKGSKKTTNDFLSNVPEVDADIQFRFSFNVVGMLSSFIVEKVCDAQVGSKLFAGSSSALAAIEEQEKASIAEEANGNPTPIVSESTGNSAPERQTSAPARTSVRPARQVYRCLSPVPFPMIVDEEFPEDLTKIKLAKLMFYPIAYQSETPKCDTRFEALGMCLLYVLAVDPKDGEDSFRLQLVEYERAVDALRYQRRPLRPARAVLLFRNGQDGKEDGSWEKTLADFEEESGPILRYGPVDLSDHAGLKGVFSTIASDRIVRTQRSDGADSDGSQQTESPPIWDAERGSEASTSTGGEDQESGDIAALQGQTHSFKNPWMTQMHKGAA